MPYKVIINTLETYVNKWDANLCTSKSINQNNPLTSETNLVRGGDQKGTTTSRFIWHSAQYKGNTQSDDGTQSPQFMVVSVTNNKSATRQVRVSIPRG